MSGYTLGALLVLAVVNTAGFFRLASEIGELAARVAKLEAELLR